RIHKRKWNTAPIRFKDQVWPELGFNPYGKIGRPVIEKAPAIGWMIKRHILMDSALGQPVRHQLCRGDGAGCHENMKIRPCCQKLIDQRQHGEGFSHTCRMKPDELSLRARAACT